MYINSQLSTCVGTQSPKYIEMAQGHISLSVGRIDCVGRGRTTVGEFTSAWEGGRAVKKWRRPMVGGSATSGGAPSAVGGALATRAMGASAVAGRGCGGHQASSKVRGEHRVPGDINH
jgi:hypothetical protein